jgi:hypothetical protein
LMRGSAEERMIRCRDRKHRVTASFAVALAIGGLLAAPAAAAPAANAASGCVACHTDVERLKAEAATIPAPPASALQAGKG